MEKQSAKQSFVGRIKDADATGCLKIASFVLTWIPFSLSFFRVSLNIHQLLFQIFQMALHIGINYE